MRVAVLGAGAIGAYVGAALARGGTDVHLIARRDNLEAIRANGVKVLSDRGDFEAHPPATDDPSEIGPVDFVFLGLKANSYATCGELLEPLLGDDTAVIAAQNGIPWWYFHGVDGPYAGRQIETVDPGGAVTKTIPPERAIGCVVYAGTELEAPGVVRHLEGTRFTIGEPDRTMSDRCRQFSEAMIEGGLKCPIEQDVRDEIWVKLMGNVAFNPLSALTRATMEEICRHDEARSCGHDDGRDARHRRGRRRAPADLDPEAPARCREGRRPQDLDAPGPRGGQAAGARGDHRRGRRACGPDGHRRPGAAGDRRGELAARPDAGPERRLSNFPRAGHTLTTALDPAATACLGSA